LEQISIIEGHMMSYKSSCFMRDIQTNNIIFNKRMKIIYFIAIA
jgi:hypothetical protein